MLDMTEEELYKFGDKDVRKVTQISMISDEGLIVLLAGELYADQNCLQVKLYYLDKALHVHVHCTCVVVFIFGK